VVTFVCVEPEDKELYDEALNTDKSHCQRWWLIVHRPPTHLNPIWRLI
jgi:hypothetical protein